MKISYFFIITFLLLSSSLPMLASQAADSDKAAPPSPLTLQDLQLQSYENQCIKELFETVPALRSKCVKTISKKDGKTKVVYTNIGLREIIFNYIGPDWRHYTTLESPEASGSIMSYGFRPVLSLQFQEDATIKAVLRRATTLLGTNYKEESMVWNIHTGAYSGNPGKYYDKPTLFLDAKEEKVSTLSDNKLFQARVENRVDDDLIAVSNQVIVEIDADQTELLRAIYNAPAPIKPYVTKRLRNRAVLNNRSWAETIKSVLGLLGSTCSEDEAS